MIAVTINLIGCSQLTLTNGAYYDVTLCILSITIRIYLVSDNKNETMIKWPQTLGKKAPDI